VESEFIIDFIVYSTADTEMKHDRESLGISTSQPHYWRCTLVRGIQSVLTDGTQAFVCASFL